MKKNEVKSNGDNKKSKIVRAKELIARIGERGSDQMESI
jgi:hypothetical protein